MLPWRSFSCSDRLASRAGESSPVGIGSATDICGCDSTRGVPGLAPTSAAADLRLRTSLMGRQPPHQAGGLDPPRAATIPSMRWRAPDSEMSVTTGSRIRLRPGVLGSTTRWSPSRTPVCAVHSSRMPVRHPHCPSGGSHNSTLLPSGSTTQPNFPYSDSSVLSTTAQPSARSAASSPARSATR